MAKEPSLKKRKLDSTSIAKQDSFSEILQQLEAEGDITGGMMAVCDKANHEDHIETSAAWPRPALKALNVKTDPISK